MINTSSIPILLALASKIGAQILFYNIHCVSN